jgi:hypothetical protein
MKKTITFFTILGFMLATNLTEANGTCTGGTTEEFYVQCNAANKLLGGCKDKDGSTCVIRAKPRDIM